MRKEAVLCSVCGKRYYFLPAHMVIHTKGHGPRLGARVIPWNKGLTADTDERTRDCAEKRMGQARSDESRKRMSEAQKGKHLTEEQKRKIGEKSRGKHLSDDAKKKLGAANKVALKHYYDTVPDARKKNSDTMKRVWQEHPEKFSGSIQALQNAGKLRRSGEMPSGAEGAHHTDEWKRDAALRMAHLWEDEEYAKTASVRSCQLWEDSGYAQKVMHRRERSGPEQTFDNLVQEHHLPFVFTGNGVFRIGRKYPDFIHVSDAKVVEIYGDFFHKNHNPQDRIDYFEQHGYRCLVLWASELKNVLEVLEKVNKFLLVEDLT